MNRFLKIGKELLMTAVWVVVALLIAVAVLSFIHSRFSGNVVGTAAEWVGTHIEYQG